MNDSFRYLLVWLALLGALAATAGSALVNLGWLNSAINLGIAAFKAALVLVVFMRLRSERLAPVFAAAALGGLFLLAALSFADFAARRIRPAPWVSPDYIPGGHPGQTFRQAPHVQDDERPTRQPANAR